MSIKASKAVVNIKKNRLIVTLAPNVNKISLNSLYTEIRFCVADLKPGFDVITDLSACTLAALSGFSIFRKISNHLIVSKVGRVVRVVDETKIIKKQLVNFASRSQSYRAEIVKSLEEAEEYLSKSGESKDLSFNLREHTVEYVCNEVQGTGTVEFLSTRECKVSPATLPLEIGSKITLAITFDHHEDLIGQFENPAEVTSSEDNGFGARFDDVDEMMKDQLWKRLVHEAQSELL